MRIPCLLALLTLGMTGCAGQPPLLERGWIGGEYEAIQSRTAFMALRGEDGLHFEAEVEPGRSRAVLVKGVYEGTPIANAGILPGDIVLSIDGEDVEKPKSLHRRIDDADPGSEIDVRVMRFGEIVESKVTVGTEAYRDVGTLAFGFSLSGLLDLVPPQFNLFGVMSYHAKDYRPSLRSPRLQVVTWSHEEREEAVHAQAERWRFWLGIFGFGRHKEVVSQELYDETTPKMDAADGAETQG